MDCDSTLINRFWKGKSSLQELRSRTGLSEAELESLVVTHLRTKASLVFFLCLPVFIMICAWIASPDAVTGFSNPDWPVWIRPLAFASMAAGTASCCYTLSLLPARQAVSIGLSLAAIVGGSIILTVSSHRVIQAVMSVFWMDVLLLVVGGVGTMMVAVDIMLRRRCNLLFKKGNLKRAT